MQDLVCLNIRIASGETPLTSKNRLFVYDEQGRLIGEYRAGGNAVTETVYLGEQPVAVLKGSKVYYVYADHLNTPRAIANAMDEIVWSWDSDPFGTAAANEDPDEDGRRFVYNLRFPGQYYDDETGLHYNYFRDYDPKIGRYVQSDPIGLEGGLNTYLYADANPITYTDPEGLNPVAAAARGGWGIGLGINYVFQAATGISIGAAIYEICNEESEEERCKKVKNDCIAQCSIFGLPSSDGTGASFRRCIRNCMERQKCFNF